MSCAHLKTLASLKMRFRFLLFLVLAIILIASAAPPKKQKKKKGHNLFDILQLPLSPDKRAIAKKAKNLSSTDPEGALKMVVDHEILNDVVTKAGGKPQVIYEIINNVLEGRVEQDVGIASLKKELQKVYKFYKTKKNHNKKKHKKNNKNMKKKKQNKKAIKTKAPKDIKVIKDIKLNNQTNKPN